MRFCERFCVNCRMEDKGYWLWLAKVSRSFLFVYIALGYAVLESCIQNF
ncbi:unnamed protein product, partial [Musa acuminata subsp. burmannicoides]